MCKLVEEYGRECAEEAQIETEKNSARRFFENGVSYEIVRASLLALSDEELQKIYQESRKCR